MKQGSSLLLLSIWLLYGCSTVPTSLQHAPENSPSLRQVQSHPERFSEVRLAWGGTILRVENRNDATLITIVERQLDKYREPRHEDRSAGRFIARFDRFLDPTIYSSGRPITVIGRFQKIERQTLDKMVYAYPLIQAETHHLWAEPEQEPAYADPFLYDPWYPFGYPYHYPYHYPYPHRH